jgi:hypothetical protein
MILGFIGKIVSSILIDQLNRPGETITAEAIGSVELPATKVQEALNRYGDQK